jgi:Family of unknown function (DUF5522)
MVRSSEDWIFQEYIKKTALSKRDPNDFYFDENGKMVMKESFHIKRGSCCGNLCKHCPYTPVHKKGNTTIFINNG